MDTEQKRKLFIGGLSFNTTDDSLKAHFEQWGTVVDCVVMKDRNTKKPKGFGFVTYESPEAVDAAQNNRPHVIDSKEVETKRATPREDAGKPEAKMSVKKIFVGGIRDDVDDEQLRDYFSHYGSVVSVDIIINKETQKKRGFAFVSFDDYDPVDKVVLEKNHQLNGKRCDVRKAVDKKDLAKIQPGGRGGGMGGGNQGGNWNQGGGNYNNGGGNYGGGNQGGNYGGGNYGNGDNYNSGGGNNWGNNQGGGNWGYNQGGDGGNFNQGNQGGQNQWGNDGYNNQSNYGNQQDNYGNQGNYGGNQQQGNYGGGYNNSGGNSGPMKGGNFSNRSSGPYGRGYGNQGSSGAGAGAGNNYGGGNQGGSYGGGNRGGNYNRGGGYNRN